MKKLVFALVLIFVALAFLAYQFEWFNITSSNYSPYKVIPKKAAVIFKVGNLKQFKHKLANTDLAKSIRNVEFIDKLYTGITVFDTTLFKEAKIKTENAYASLHLTGSNEYDYLFILENESSFSSKKLLKYAAKHKLQLLKRQYEQTELFELKTANGQTLTIVFLENLVVFSNTAFLVEQSVNQTKNSIDLEKDNYFKKLLAIASKSNDFSVFVNYENLSSILKNYLNNNKTVLARLLSNFADWSELDIILKDNAILLNGYTITKKDGEQSLDLYKNNAVNSSLLNIIPKDIALLVHSNSVAFVKDDEQIENSKENLLNWMGNEWAYCLNEPFDSNIVREQFLVFNALDTTTALTVFRQYGEQISFENNAFKIFRISNKSIFKSGFENYINAQDEYVVAIENYIIHAHSLRTLKSIIDKYLNQQTLARSPDYLKFAEHMISGANKYIYLNPAKVNELLKYLLDATKINETNVLSSLKYFNKIGLQFSNEGNKFFTNAYFTFDQTAGNSLSLLWELDLDTSVSMNPQVVINHNDNSKEIIVQDDKDKIYLLTRGGNIIWERQLDEPIMGKVYQMDYYQNGKLQYLFNTPGNIYLIDRLGRDVENFPLRLTSPASNSLFLVDYDNNKGYRFFLASSNKNLYGFNERGRPLTGWNPKKKMGDIEFPLQHFSIKGKDYLVVVNNKGTVFLFNRRGELRTAPILLKTKINQAFNINTSSEPAKIVTTDTNGTVFEITVKGEVVKKVMGVNTSQEADETELWTSKHKFVYEDLDQDGVYEYLFLDNKSLVVFDQDGTLLFRNQFKEELLTELFTLENDGAYNIGVCTGSGLVYLFNSSGTLLDGFPIRGEGSFEITNLFNDNSKVIVVNKNKTSIVAYKL